jgi:glycosyltransferase involved in cell wall biosynthesis
MKILWISNAPWMPSGYGSQSRQAGSRIAQAGYDIEFVANDGTRGDREWNGLLVRGAGYDVYSRDSVREDLARSEADWVISLYDAWVYTVEGKDPFEGLPRIASWIPVDHFPVPMDLHPWLANGHMPIAMSRFGQEWLQKLSDVWAQDGHGFPVRYVPHAVDDVFRPVETGFRQSIGVPEDAYLVGIVAANNGTLTYDRKGFGEMASALAVFMETHPDAYVYVHSIVDGRGAMNLHGLFGFKAVPDERIRWADQYAIKKQNVSDEDMAAMYSSFDVLLATSRGEGFGIPVIEAQACGTPVIASNWTAQAELVGDVWSLDATGSQRHPNGWLVRVEPDYDPRHGADFGKPVIGAVVAALNDAYDHRGEPAIRDAAIAKAEGYRADAVFEKHWKPLLAEMDAQLHPIPLNREQRRALRR